LNIDLAEFFSNVILQLIQQANLTPQDVDLVASHGQTIWHLVRPDGTVHGTLQIAEASVIAERTQITTIDNFRARDVSVGGQGAPLTAYVDWLLLRHPHHWRAVQNIGGMANVTMLPPLSDTQSQAIAFDTGVGNALIDASILHITDGQQAFDENGAFARQGNIHEEWLEELLQHPYYSRGLPKTTGREEFGTAMANQLIQQTRAKNLRDEDIVATLTTLTAQTIADAYQRYAPQPIHEVILGGGGWRNPVLVELLQQFMPTAKILSHEDIGLDSDFKEALVFAVLGYETWHGRAGNGTLMTGAEKPVILGQITPGHNYARLIRQIWCSTENS
jgi:anhydro-N-acetylmuramic acid kinase